MPPRKATSPKAPERPVAPASRPSPGPPRARRQKLVETLHGVEVADPYRWLEQAKSAETRRWVSAQDAHARRALAQLPGRSMLRERLKELSYIEWISAPVRRGKRFFFTRQHADREKAVWYWRQGERGKPRVLIDPNKLSEDGSIALSGVSISWDGLRVAYKLSENAADDATLYVMEVATGKVSAVDTIPGARYAHASWTPRGDGFYYTRLPTDPAIPRAELPGHAAVYFHRLGERHDRDQLVHKKTGDPTKFIGPSLSRDGRFLVIHIHHGWTATDLYFKDLRRRDRRFRRLAVGIEAHFGVEAHRGRFYVLTDHGAPNYRLFKVDPRRVERRSWREIVPEKKDAVLQRVSVVGGHLSLLYLRRAATELHIATLGGRPLRQVRFPGIGSASGLSGNPEDDTAYFSFTSYTRPTTIFRTSVRRGGRRVYFKPEVPIAPAPFLTEQVTYKSKDGTPVTMFIVRRKDQPMDGSTPYLLAGYGGFNISLTPQFYASRFIWLEQGGGLAIPNLRGGGEYGEDWHRGGMLLNKKNTFDDFIAAAEHLIRKRYTSPSKLVIRGGSNGGLLVGAAMVQRPELFRAVACHVPLLDMLRYHRFGAGKTWISEYGSADDPQQFRAIYAYSPYHHVGRASYPALLMMSADSDDRVDPMHARKFTAAVQQATTSGRPVLLRVESKAGHGGGDMIKKQVEADADEYTFLLAQVGVKPAAKKPTP
jgi:prolyl oligopeptidase